MYVAHGTSTPRADESRYHVPNSKIIEVEITLESMKEELEPPLVES